MTDLLQRFARITPYFRRGRAGILAAGLGSLIGAATEPMIPALFQPLLDRGFAAGALPLWWVPLAVIGLFGLRGAAGFVAQYGLAWTAGLGVLALRQALFDTLLRAAPPLFARHAASSLNNTLVYEIQGGATLLVGSLLTLVKDSLTMLALLGYLLFLNWKLTLFVAVLAPALAWVMQRVSRRLRRLALASQTASDQLAYVVEENVAGWRNVRLHDAQERQAQRFAGHSQTLRRVLMKTLAASATLTPVTQMLAACALSAVITMALWQSTSSGTTVGGFVSYITAMLMLVAPIKHLSDVVGPITRGLAAIERALDLISAHPPEVCGAHAPVRAMGHIQFQQCGLRYGDAQALEHIELDIPPGQTVALVGPSGAGKTSLVNLLPRFVEPSSGRVLLDGVPLADWDVRALRRQFALVSQDVVLFNDSVAANVAVGESADLLRVQQALEGANLTDFVAGLPQGIHGLIGHNGSQLSGGQRQRLAIARALYKDAPLLILDEATSALDSESERAVQDALQTLMRGRTTLIIAHRLSTIEHAQRIVVMQAGRVVEQGAHAQLLAAGGLYARLHGMQFRSPAPAAPASAALG